MDSLPAYAELHCRSNFSFLAGASHPGELVERAAQLGYTALAITDECSLAGVVRAHVQAKEHPGLKLVIGSEMRLAAPDGDEGEMRLVLLAQDLRGYKNLSHWITVARRRADKGRYDARPGDLEGRVPDAPQLAGLPGCRALLVPQPGQAADKVLAQARWLKRWFQDRAAIAIELLLRAGDDVLVAAVQRAAAETGLALVASGDVVMHLRSRKPLHDVLTATRLNMPVAQCGWQLASNAEQHLRSRGRLARLYAPQWMNNAVAVASSCGFSLDELRYEYPAELVPEGETPTTHLRALTYAGVPYRFPEGLPEEFRLQIEEELALIAKLKFEAFFLTVADLVKWARAQGILCQGRGSAANSLVCYCLRVTEANPRDAKLLFGRFLSEERGEPPDIDVDFEHQRREEVIQYIYRKYGRHRAALTAVVISYRSRSAVRDVGRALGIDPQRIDAVSKSQQWFDGSCISDDRLRENGFDPDAPLVQRWSELTAQLVGFPRHLSQHPGGFLIASEQIAHLVPVENASMEDRTVIQWDKDDLDALRLLKVDVLALGMLSAMRRSFEFIGRKKGHEFGMSQVPSGDEPTYDMICQADTIGVFQIESRAQMSMLPRLKPRQYYDLVVQVAIVRPGPILGGMVHPYLKNRELPDEKIDCPEGLKPALMRTKGVPIFQEQVMQIAMLAADFTVGEADQLRRAMAAWKRKGGLGHFHARLVGRMVENGYALDYAERIFKQVEGFGEYGFPESHAAGFALLAYQSSWIKCHHPDAFLAALLNSQPMGFYAAAQLVRDARAHGVVVRPVDVSLSAAECELEAGAPGASWPVRLGFNSVGGLGSEAGARIVEARAQAPFASVEDLARRAALDAGDLNALADADALRGLSGHRHQAAWAVAGIDTRPTALLRATRVHEEAAEMEAPAEVENMLADYRALGLTLNRHPLALLREQLAGFKVQTAAELRDCPHGRLARASGLVTHRQRPPTAKGTMFVTIEDETGAVNVIVWPKVVEAQRQPLLAARLLTVYGQWQRQGDDRHAVMHLVATRVVDHTPLLQGLATRSRDFH